MAAAAATSNTLPMREHVSSRTAVRRGLSSRLPEEQEEGGVAVSCWCDLPPDLYGDILRRLPSRIDRVRLGAVCRHWRVCARRHSPRLPVRVARTARGTHVAHVRGLSRLQEHRCVGGFVDSPGFAVAGLHWAIRIRYYPPPPPPGGSDGDEDDGGVGVFVVLLTEGEVAWAYVGLLLLDQTTGLPDTLIWDEHRTRFDAATAYCSWARARGTGKLLAKRSELMGSRFVRGDCLKIECVLDDVCRDRDQDHRMFSSNRPCALLRVPAVVRLVSGTITSLSVI